MQAFTENSIEQSKVVKDEEWDRLPLETEEQLQKWWKDRLELLKRGKERVPSPEETSEIRQDTESPWSQSFSDESSIVRQPRLHRRNLEVASVHSTILNGDISMNNSGENPHTDLAHSHTVLIDDSWSTDAAGQPMPENNTVHGVLGDTTTFWSGQVTAPELQENQLRAAMHAKDGPPSPSTSSPVENNQQRLKRLTSEQRQKYF